MAGRKRAANESSTRETRSAKATKTDTAKSPKNAGKEPRGAARLKTSVSAAAFKARALPLHVNLTHTPPAAAGPEEGSTSVAQVDPGFVGSTTLIGSSFSTGSFGWKGNKRLTIELPGVDGAEKETVHVQLTINATVIGSKDAKETDDDKEGEAEAQKETEEPKEITEKEPEPSKEENAMEVVEQKAAENAPEEAPEGDAVEVEAAKENGENGTAAENEGL
ncbi:hypothetical protein SERLA73DRAFT_185922 [Serpula lacrymans var. lacrymans S7.3]|uniref:Uncharacterized protein n=2 Tax=Serpula lacrymans var. lacrymans TaxID=341189 RepID=F8Q6N0_SERL3|nr:uncharacterized protein SERLADRAFT_474699 [Serpula lacrymans var. lacrymans S7.9]EGN96268.1 hypothetical protein SERLA73DRAFT_185922 [Serpula lacrymans var. lacrymans S7.3]EGO21807.1 hypothetical protein SERLADRAFT_474699 [Serpula lacrymans var. lacrymans S7.9]